MENQRKTYTRIFQLSKNKNKPILTPKMVLIAISISILLIISILIYSAFRAGGIDKLFDGEKDIVSNAINNIGTTFDPNASNTPTKTPGPLFIDDTGIDPNQEVVLSSPVNDVTLEYPTTNYNFTVKVGLPLIIQNQTEKDIVLKFSNSMELRILNERSSSITFTKTGMLTFYDLLDKESGVRGSINVVP